MSSSKDNMEDNISTSTYWISSAFIIFVVICAGVSIWFSETSPTVKFEERPLSDGHWDCYVSDNGKSRTCLRVDDLVHPVETTITVPTDMPEGTYDMKVMFFEK